MANRALKCIKKSVVLRKLFVLVGLTLVSGVLLYNLPEAQSAAQSQIKDLRRGAQKQYNDGNY